MKRILPFIALCLAGCNTAETSHQPKMETTYPSAATQAQQEPYPWRSADFFNQCDDFNDPRIVDNEQKPDLVAQYQMCGRFIEGVEMGARGEQGISENCLINPFALFQSAETLYERNNRATLLPGSYLKAAMKKECLSSRWR